MSYKIRNLLVCCSFSCLLLMGGEKAYAQGVVSLSEEAMFDDELETNKDFLAEQAQPQPQASAQDQDQVQAQPQAPTVFPKGPNAPAAQPSEPTAAKAPVQTVEAVDKLPVLAITDKKINNTKKTIDTSVSQDTKGGVDDLFTQMSDIERNTTLLNLQLKREKLQNEIEAVKNQRRLAIEQEKQKAEELKQKQKEKEQEQERLKLQEQQKLRELDITFENLRQEKLLKAYKNQMLEEQQKWIEHDALFYKNIDDLRKEKQALIQKHQEDLSGLQAAADNAYRSYQLKLETHKNEISNLNSQIDVLRNRLSSMEQELEASRSNPFATDSAGAVPSTGSTEASPSAGTDFSSDTSAIKAEPINNSLAKYYAVTEIRGQGGELIAKLINKNGLAFYVKKGTALQTGHIISEITSTYVAADKNYKKDYIYFSAGGILPEEVSAFELEKNNGKQSL